VGKNPKVVLTAPATEMSSHYGKIFLGFGACISAPPFPSWFTKILFYPTVKHNNGQADVAPYSLRKIEASLLENGFDEDDVVTAHPARLKKVVGPETKAVAITVMDPLGFGPTSLTFSSIFSGESATHTEFKNLMREECFSRHKPSIIVGGPGAWQLHHAKEALNKYGISTLVMGEGDVVTPGLVWKAVKNEELPRIVSADDAEVENVPTIRNPSVGGLVEVSRGCGKNCQFCSPTLRSKRDFPIGKIVEEVRVNQKHKLNTICLHAEDVLIYGSGPWNKFTPNREKVMELFTKTLEVTKEPWIGVSHISLGSVAADEKLVQDISELLEIGKNKYAPLFGYQTGIESGSVNLMRKHMGGKALPFKTEQWPEVVEQAFGISKDNKWIPIATLIMGLPGETPDDIVANFELIDRLKDCPSFIVPQFFIPLTDTVLEKENIFCTTGMSDEHWQLLLKCTDHSAQWADLLRSLYFSPDSSFMRFGYWLGYKLLYLFAWIGGKQATKRLGLKLKSQPR